MRTLLLALVATSAFAFEPVRFPPTQMGLQYRVNAEFLQDTRVVPSVDATQYAVSMKVEGLDMLYLPAVLRAYRVPSCKTTAINTGAVALIWKAVMTYQVDRLRNGNSYSWGQTYPYDQVQAVLKSLQACVMIKPKDNATSPYLTPAVLDLLAIHVVHGVLTRDLLTPHPMANTTVDTTPGTICRKMTRQSLTTNQRDLLHAAMIIHQQQADAVLAGDMGVAAALGVEVHAAQIAFAESARDADEAVMFDMQFTGDIDPQRTLAEVQAFTRSLQAWHHQWGAALDTLAAPNCVAVAVAKLGHMREHFLRAAKVPGLKLRTVCNGDVHYCPQTDAAAPPS